MPQRHRRSLLLVAVSALLLVGAAGPTQTFDFAKFDESQWTPAHEDGYASAGTFVQEEGDISNGPGELPGKPETPQARNARWYIMRLVKDLEVKDGRAELDLELFGTAAPGIAFRAQMPDGEIHGPLYELIIFNQSTEKKDYQGLNLWKWEAPRDPKTPKWQKVAYWNVPIPRERRLKLGVAFKGQTFEVFVDGKLIGEVRDAAALGAGKIGIIASEGPSKFYSFTVTPQN
jgi:hypothetical protein